MASRKRPIAQRDEHGECMHLYLTRDATCVHCGMRFGLAWSADRNWITKPLQRNLFGGILAFGVLASLWAFGQDMFAMFALFLGVYFFIRVGFGTLETFLKHRFVPGKLGELVERSKLNISAMKPAYAWVGRSKFPIDKQVYSQFSPGDTLLIEYLRWSRLPVAIYRGHRPG